MNIKASYISCQRQPRPKTCPPESFCHRSILSQTTSGTSPVNTVGSIFKLLKRFFSSHLDNIPVTDYSAIPEASCKVKMDISKILWGNVVVNVVVGMFVLVFVDEVDWDWDQDKARRPFGLF